MGELLAIHAIRTGRLEIFIIRVQHSVMENRHVTDADTIVSRLESFTYCTRIETFGAAEGLCFPAQVCGLAERDRPQQLLGRHAAHGARAGHGERARS